jgi:hypothetical protein
MCLIYSVFGIKRITCFPFMLDIYMVYLIHIRLSGDVAAEVKRVIAAAEKSGRGEPGNKIGAGEPGNAEGTSVGAGTEVGAEAAAAATAGVCSIFIRLYSCVLPIHTYIHKTNTYT